MKLKKWLLGLITFAAMVVLCVVVAGAETYGDYEYYVLDDGTVEITEYNGTAETVDIPTKIDGKKLTGIGFCAFYDCRSLKSITIPDSVAWIDDSAFSGCSNLTSINMPNSVTSIGDYAFMDCKSLTSITIPNRVTRIGENALTGCTNLTAINVATGSQNYDSVNGVLYNKDKTDLICYPNGKKDKNYKMPDSVTSIGENAFMGCINLTNITIPNGVTSIGGSAFNGCTSLTSITIPDSVTVIDFGAFSDCTSLLSIIISNSVSSIEYGTFNGCISLTSITIPDSVTNIGSDAFSGCTSLESIMIPNSVTEIGWGAFGKCTSLKNITIPNSVTSIGDSAFRGCTNLTSITIPNSVTSIGNSAFSGSTSLTAINVATGNKNYVSVNGVLYNKDKTTIICYPAGKKDENFKIPDGVTKIAESAFECCASLTSITIPDSVTMIDGSAFNGCTSLTSISIPNSVTHIGDDSFIGCTSLTAINVATGDQLYFSVNGVLYVKNLYYEDKTYLICYPAGKKDDKYVIIDGAINIADSAFSGCMNLTSITIPNSVTWISESAFSGCTSLKSITIPDSVTSIGNYAFSGCTSLTSIKIPKSTTSIADYVFSDCTSLTSITIPNSVESIGTAAFENCTSLISITIPNSVTSIYGCAFRGCNGLTSITIPKSVTSIGDWAFGYYYDNDYKKIDNFKIYCYPGTDAEKYAKENGLDYEVISCKKHDYSTWKTTKSATCTTTGTQTRTCSICGKTETQTIKALGHSYSTTWTTDKAATCGAAGSKSHHCTRCSAKKDVTAIPATGKHTFGAWKTTKAATYTATGTKTRTCTVCKKTETATIAKLTLAKVSGFKVKTKDSTSITLQWNKNNSASGYIIEAYNGKAWSQIAKITSNNTLTYKVTKLSASKTYQYRIKAYKTEGKATAYSANSATLSVNTNPSGMSGYKVKSKTSTSVTLQWNKNTSATGYELQKWDGKKWVALTKITKNSTTTYTIKSLKASTTYKYRIRAYKTIGKATQYSGYTELSVNTNPSNMSGYKVKSKSYNSVTLQWNKNTSATGYELQKWDGKKWVALTKITKNSTTTYTVKSLKASTTYKYRIRAYKTIGKATQYSGYTELSVNTNPSNMSGFKAKSTAKTSVTLQWNKNTSATGYELQKWDGKKWVSAAKVTKNSTVTSTVKSLKANTSYKFRIRAYKTIGKATQYSSWSSTLTVKTKK